MSRFNKGKKRSLVKSLGCEKMPHVFNDPPGCLLEAQGNGRSTNLRVRLIDKKIYRTLLGNGLRQEEKKKVSIEKMTHSKAWKKKNEESE